MLQWVINIVLIHIISIYTCIAILAAIVHWTTTILSFLSCFISKCHGTLLFSQISNMFICAIFEHIFFSDDKEIYYIRFSIINKRYRNQVPVVKPRYHWKTEHYKGSNDNFEGYIESDLNHLDSGNIRKYTTLPSQWELLTWTWIWHPMYFDCWYHFEKRPGSV